MLRNPEQFWQSPAEQATFKFVKALVQIRSGVVIARSAAIVPRLIARVPQAERVLRRFRRVSRGA